MAVADAPAWTRSALENEAALHAFKIHILSEPDLLESIDRARAAHESGDVLTIEQFEQGLFD